jgi:hypothetical protein
MVNLKGERSKLYADIRSVIETARRRTIGVFAAMRAP